ncbi:hypothetical protein [Sphingomonas koreensis]
MITPMNREELIAQIKEALRGPEGEEYTDAGMEDAFFRWPAIERAISAALESRTAPTEVYLADRFQWAAPGDQQEDAWLVRFCDNDIRDAIYTGPDAEREAWEAWNRHAPGYNMYVFRLARLATETQPVAGGGRAREILPGDAIEPWPAQVVAWREEYGVDYLETEMAASRNTLARWEAGPSGPRPSTQRALRRMMSDVRRERNPETPKPTTPERAKAMEEAARWRELAQRTLAYLPSTLGVTADIRAALSASPPEVVEPARQFGRRKSSS